VGEGAPFVGAERQALVERLLAAFDRVRDGDGPTLQALIAPSGAGKTRVVQELYAALAAAQPAPPYWPARIETRGGATLDWKHGRKLVYPPSPEVPAGAEPTWLWWGVSCALRADGGATQALFEDRTQLVAHAGAMLDRIRPTELFARGVDATEALVAVVGITAGLAIAPVGAAALTAAGLATLVSGNADLAARLRDWAARRREHGVDHVVDAEASGRRRQAKELADALVRLSDRMPVVMVVDDAQWADSSLIEFLGGLLRRQDARILVIATVWPVGDGADGVPDWLDTLRHDADCGPRVRCERLPPLATADLAALVRAEHRRLAGVPDAPHAEMDARVLEVVLERVGATPLGVRALFGVRRVRETVRERGLRADDLERLPADLERALEEYVRDLPTAVRELLVRAAVIGPRAPVAPLLGRIGDRPAVDATTIAAALDDHALLRSPSDGVLEFVDHAVLGVASTVADDELTSDERGRIARDLAELAERLDLSSHPTLLEATWAAHVRLARDGLVGTGSAAVSALRLARRAAGRHALSEAIDLAGSAASWMEREGGPLDRAVVGHDRARWLIAAGRAGWAVEVARRALHDLAAVGEGVASAQLLSTRAVYAHAVAEAGRPDEALAELSRIRADHGAALEAGEPRALAARNLEGMLLLRTARPMEAIAVLEPLVASLTTSPGAPIALMLAARTNLARAYGESGRATEAVELFRDLIATKERMFGPDHAGTLNDRANLARWLGETGRTEEALAVAEQLLADSDRLIGIHHPQTLARSNLIANILEFAGRLDEAVERYRLVLAAKAAVLEPDHPHRLITRTDLVRSLLAAERLDEAAALLPELRSDVDRSLAEDDPLRVSVRILEAAARARGVSGSVDAEAAIRALETEARTASERFGATSGVAALARNALGMALCSIGRIGDGTATLARLVADLSAGLGARHRHTLTVRSNLVTALLAGGDRGARGLARDLARDLAAVWGEEHRFTRHVTALAAG
jgi:tetratricopeptide (TPR) repeat protein